MKDVASVCIGAGYQSILGSLKSRFEEILEWPPEVQYLRHLRHAASHGNKFRINNLRGGEPGINPKQPPKWRTSKMKSVNDMEGKQLFDEFLLPGDIPVLLSDIRHLLRPYE